MLVTLFRWIQTFFYPAKVRGQLIGNYSYRILWYIKYHRRQKEKCLDSCSSYSWYIDYYVYFSIGNAMVQHTKVLNLTIQIFFVYWWAASFNVVLACPHRDQACSNKVKQGVSWYSTSMNCIDFKRKQPNHQHCCFCFVVLHGINSPDNTLVLLVQTSQISFYVSKEAIDGNIKNTILISHYWHFIQTIQVLLMG